LGIVAGAAGGAVDRGFGRAFAGSKALVGTGTLAITVEFAYLGTEGTIILGTLTIPLGLRGIFVGVAGKAVTTLTAAKAARIKERIMRVMKRVVVD
jgi:hypothetical protein